MCVWREILVCVILMCVWRDTGVCHTGVCGAR